MSNPTEFLAFSESSHFFYFFFTSPLSRGRYALLKKLLAAPSDSAPEQHHKRRTPTSETMNSDESKPAGKPQDDELFAASRIEDFNFDRHTSGVFDDMLDRSVPCYAEIQRMVGELATDFALPGTRIYDLGCSTCNSFISIDQYLPRHLDVQFVGMDVSEEMLAKAQEELRRHQFSRRYRLQCADLDKGVTVVDASVVLMNLTLQFIRPLCRQSLIRLIRAGLIDSGCLIIVDKVLGDDSTFNRLFIKHYHAMKRRNGYNEIEIARKREPVEKISVPYRLEENKQLLLNAGFERVEMFFRWYNFCGLIAVK